MNHKSSSCHWLLWKTRKELEWLQSLGIITPVSFSDWAAPIVPVVKSDTNIRICDDYKVTINQASQTDSYPLPHVDIIWWWLKNIYNNQHTQGIVLVSEITFWHFNCTSIVSTYHGSLLQGLSKVCVYIEDIYLQVWMKRIIYNT